MGHSLAAGRKEFEICLLYFYAEIGVWKEKYCSLFTMVWSIL